ncbi:29912_t:CDS:2, partial [Racocetra persica]
IFKYVENEITFFHEYACDGTLRQYLEQNFCTIDWNERLHLAKQLVKENENNQESILDITSLPALNIKYDHGGLRLYDLNQLFITQFDKQGISGNTTCSIIYYIESIIGFFYEYGIGTDVNHYMAYDMYSKAVKEICVPLNEQDNLLNNLLKENQRIGLISLGLLYKYGKGIEVNQLKAFRLFLKSVSKGSILGIGNAKAQTIVGYCYQYGEGIYESNKLAFDWYTKSAKNGNTLGLVHLAECHLNGIGIPKNKQQAFQYYLESVNGGSELGKNNLAFCYQKGVGTPKNDKKAQKLLDMPTYYRYKHFNVLYK